MQGVGVEKQSDIEAEQWWLDAADDGNPKGSIKAQTMLGMFYSRPETLDLKRYTFMVNAFLEEEVVVFIHGLLLPFSKSVHWSVF